MSTKISGPHDQLSHNHRVRFLSTNRPGPRMGMGHYERLLIHHLLQEVQNAPDTWQFGITFDGRRTEVLDPARIEPGLHYANFLGFSTARLQQLPWPLAYNLVHRGLVHSPQDLYHSLSLSFPPPNDKPAVFTIHDLPPARFPDEGTVPKWAKQAAQRARAILTPSVFAKEELVQLLGLKEENVYVIPNGCEHGRFHPGIVPADVPTLKNFGIEGPFLIYVGGFTQRKNVRNLLTAWQLIATEYSELSLVLVGPTTPLQALAQEIKAPRVVVSGYMDRDILPSVMKAATALVFPSIYEGFGLPPQEALAMGVPVVAVSTGGAIPEVVGDAGILAESGEPESIATSIRQLLDDGNLAERLKVRGPAQVQQFSWQQHARAVLDVYRKVLL